MLPRDAIDHSIQQHPNAAMGYGGAGEDLLAYSMYYEQSDLLPPWGTRRRDATLRALWYHTHNTVLQGAIAGLIMRVRSTPYEISGGRNLTKYWQEILFEGAFGEGYDVLMDKFLLDFFTTGFGGVFEIIGRGRTDRPLPSTRRVDGIAQLDSLWCAATGDPEYPIYYSDPYSGAVHKLHHTRVVRIADLVSPQRTVWGRGLSIFERAIAVSNKQVLLSRHETELLNSQPPTGFITISGARQDQIDQLEKGHAMDEAAHGNALFRRAIRLTSLSPGTPVEVKFIPFSQLPEGFDYEKFMNQHVNQVALAIGVDPQDIWPLTGAPMGTGEQSRILAAKGQAKTYGSTLRRLERIFNSLLPKELEFKFKPNDDEGEKQEAEQAQIWVNIGIQLKQSGADEEQVQRLLANKVPAIADVLLDASGELIRIADDDVKAEINEVIATDQTPLAQTPEETPDDAARIDDTDSTANGGGVELRWLRLDLHGKVYNETRLDFSSAFGDLIAGALEDSVTRRRFGTVARALLKRYGQQAYKDGLKDGGVNLADGEGLDDDDLTQLADWLAVQSEYVTAFADKLFSEQPGFENINNKVTLWANKSLSEAYQLGLESADKNGMYEFVGDDGEESCADCKRLKNQIHRLKDWNKKNLNPRKSGFAGECGGWRCNHYLEKTSSRASGRY